MSLKNIKMKTKAAKVAFDAFPGFVLDVSFITRDMSSKLQEEATRTVIDSKLKIPRDELDKDAFIDSFVRAAIQGWEGLTYEYVSQLMLIDVSGIEDLNSTLEYSHEDAVELVKSSQIFDAWLNEVIFDLDRFRDRKERKDS